MLHMAIDAGNALLVMGRIRERHAVFFVAVNAKLRNIICYDLGIARLIRFLQRGTVWIMTGRAIHAELVMLACFPILHSKV